jgi:hypothetical protein
MAGVDAHYSTRDIEARLLAAIRAAGLNPDIGFIAELFEDTSVAHLRRTAANATPAAPGQLGLAAFVDDLARKAGNARRSLEEGQVRLVRGVFRAR